MVSVFFGGEIPRRKTFQKYELQPFVFQKTLVRQRLLTNNPGVFEHSLRFLKWFWSKLPRKLWSAFLLKLRLPLLLNWLKCLLLDHEPDVHALTVFQILTNLSIIASLTSTCTWMSGIILFTCTISYWIFTFILTFIIVLFLSLATFSTIKFTSAVTRSVFCECRQFIYSLDHINTFRLMSSVFRDPYSIEWIIDTIEAPIKPIYTNNEWIVMKLIRIQINKRWPDNVLLIVHRDTLYIQ